MNGRRSKNRSLHTDGVGQMCFIVTQCIMPCLTFLANYRFVLLFLAVIYIYKVHQFHLVVLPKDFVLFFCFEIVTLFASPYFDGKRAAISKQTNLFQQSNPNRSFIVLTQKSNDCSLVHLQCSCACHSANLSTYIYQKSLVVSDSTNVIK